MSGFDYDLLVLGAGSGGVAGGRRAASYGARVAIVESDRVGGTCVLRGCVPKKLLMYGAEFARSFQDAAGFGWTVAATAEWPQLIAAKDKELDRLNGVYKTMLANAGVTLLSGRGALVGPQSAVIDGKIVTAEKILIATGGHAVRPEIPGAALGILSDDFLDLPRLPKRLAVLGGGYIGLEFACMAQAMGSEVTVVARSGLLRGFDEELRAHLTDLLTSQGLDLRAGLRPTAIRAEGADKILSLDDGSEIRADAVLIATGRKPNIAGLGLETVGVALTPGGAIQVDDDQRTSVPSIYAVGDVTDRINLTPVAINEARAFAETHFNANPSRANHENVPTAVFTLPPVGVVGLTEQAALKQGRRVDIYTTRFRPMKNTLAGREERTFMKLVVDADDDRVLGVHMVGPDAPEIVQGFAVALNCGATKRQFDRTVGLHPSAAEELVTLRDKARAVAP